MEADWEIEVGGEAPVMDAHCPGFVDLRLQPERICELAEARQSPGMARALLQLNHRASTVWTAKCDIWEVMDIDPDELDASREESAYGIGCYVDLLPQRAAMWKAPALAEAWCRLICAKLRPVSLRCCRADLVVRSAVWRTDREGLGVTAYLTACGVSQAAATAALDQCLAVLVTAVRGRRSAGGHASMQL